jgi:CRP-like cAMP-binding protein
MSHRREKVQLNFQKGEYIFREGDRGNKLFIITSGEVEIFKKVDDEEVPLVSLKSGSVFGEMALVGGGYRSASAKAVTRVACFAMSQAMFRHKLATEVPSWMQALFTALVDRLRVTTIKSLEKSKVVPGRQVVELLAMFIRKGETTPSGYVFIPWEDAAKKIAYVLDIKKKQVERVMQLLANSELAGFEAQPGGGRRFMIRKPEAFYQFAEFCEESHLKDRRTRGPDQEARESRDHHVLTLILEVLKEDEEPLIFGHDELLKRIESWHSIASGAYEETAQRMVDQGIFEIHAKEESKTIYLINRDLCREKITSIEMRETFAKVTREITEPGSSKPSEEEKVV